MHKAIQVLYCTCTVDIHAFYFQIDKLQVTVAHAALIYTRVTNPKRQTGGYKACSPYVLSVLEDKTMPITALFNKAVRQEYLKGNFIYLQAILLV